jgi:hypothetical protein
VSDGEGGIDRDEVECAMANMIYKVSHVLPDNVRKGVCINLSNRRS